MIEALGKAAREAGLTDLHLLKIADASLPPEQAVAALRERYPAAFRFTARHLPREDYAAAKREMLATHQCAWLRRWMEDDLKRAVGRLGSKR